MLGGPLGKLLLLVFVIAAVWYGFKYISRVNQVREEQRRRAPGPTGPSRQIDDMSQCRVCGAYVTADARNCGRADCPY
jgi:uncharacterized protein